MPGSSWRSSWSSSGTSSTMERCVISVSHILYTTLCPITLTVRGLCGHTCVRLCVYSTWWLMQGKSRWVKTTSVRCSVCEVIIYSLWTKLPSNLTLFTTPVQGGWQKKLSWKIGDRIEKKQTTSSRRKLEREDVFQCGQLNLYFCSFTGLNCFCIPTGGLTLFVPFDVSLVIYLNNNNTNHQFRLQQQEGQV